MKQRYRQLWWRMTAASLVVSLIPLFTPMVMFMRISVLTPPFWQIALSIVLVLGTIWLLFRGVAKIYVTKWRTSNVNAFSMPWNHARAIKPRPRGRSASLTR